MKKILAFVASLLLTGAIAQINNEKPTQELNSNSVVQTPFTAVVVNADIELVLTQSGNGLSEITGNKKNLDQVYFFVKKGTLYIETNNSTTINHPVIHLSVRQLENLEVNANAKIRSKGLLESRNLSVNVNSEAYFDLKSTGSIYFDAAADIQLHFHHGQNGQNKIKMRLHHPLSRR